MPAASIQFYAYSSVDELAEQLADHTACLLAAALDSRKKAGLVVSGGSTPAPLFSRLAARELPWQHVVISLADERWVDTSDKASNEHLVRSLLLRDHAARARFIGLKNNAATAAAGEQACHESLRHLPRPIDLVILGMGEDGHTASLFPADERLAAATDMHSARNCLAVRPPDSSFARMTLTLPVLLDSRRIILHITGKRKKQVLEQAMAPGSPFEMPVRWILGQQTTPVEIFWAP